MRREQGFTLIEMLATLALVGILVALAAPSLRSYWTTQALYGARDEVRGELRYLQTRVTAESNPLVYGLRFPVAGSNVFGVVRFDPTPTASSPQGRCFQVEWASTNAAFSPGGAKVTFPSTNYDPATNPTAFGFKADGSTPTPFCRDNITNADGSAVTTPAAAVTDQYAWFYARGTAVPGRLQISHSALPGKTLSLTVTPLTGRVGSP